MIKSKRILIAVLLATLIFPVFAQTKVTTASAKDCYGDWYKLFRERGAKPIPDGTHDIVISLRKESYSECYMGKVDVVDGKLKAPVLVAKEDGTFETLVDAGLKLDPAMISSVSPDALVTITNGMSITAYTTDREAVKLFFYKYVNDKPKKNKVAPSTSVLVKN